MNITTQKKGQGGNRRKGRNASAVKAGKKSVEKITKQISALKTRFTELEKGKDKKRNGSEDDISDAAGNEFGGRGSKRAKN